MREEIRPLFEEIDRALIGRGTAVRKCLIALFGDGHLLLEDIPGVGKTTLSKAIAAAAGLKTKRVQFTPDTLPSDITGFTMWDAQKKEFRFHEGAVITNILLADEINRTSPRTQAALLQAMEEGCVSEEGMTAELEKPFMVIATQNPYGSAGTMPLPPSQLDRFMMKLSLGRPDAKELRQMILTRASGSPVINKVFDREAVLAAREAVEQVRISEAAADWIAALSEETETDPDTAHGLSPRAVLSIAAAARASAYIEGRDYVIPQDIADIFADCAAHRIILTPEASGSGRKAEDICGGILRRLPPPHIKR